MKFLSAFAVATLAVAALAGVSAQSGSSDVTPNDPSSSLSPHPNPKNTDIPCNFCIAQAVCPKCSTSERCEIIPQLCRRCSTATCRSLSQPVGGTPTEQVRTQEIFNNDPKEKADRRAGRCISCLVGPTCPACASDEMCVVTLPTCTTCAKAICVSRK
jgi:hypothetical protein